MLDMETYLSGKNRKRRQTKKKMAQRKVGEIKEAGNLNPVTWETKSKKIFFDDMKIGIASDSKKAKRVAKEFAKTKGLSFFPCR